MPKRILSNMVPLLMSICAILYPFSAFNVQLLKTSYSPDTMTWNSRQINTTLSFAEPQRTRVGNYDWLTMKNCSYLGRIGQPMLPVKSLVFKLSERSIIRNVKVDVKEVQLEGRFSILPASQPTWMGSNTPRTIEEDPNIYKSNNIFPEEWYVWREGHGIDPKTNKRVKYLIIHLFPLRYLPLERRLKYAEENSIAINYDEPASTIQSVSTSLKNLIITSPTLEAYAIQLADWKNITGISSRVLNTTWIYSHYSGADTQEKIRNCIKDFVATYEISYVTIFGDADQVPVRYAYVPDGVDVYTPTDLYYADLDGTWDDNGDGIYADQGNDTVDGIPDVYIGRIPPSLAEYAETAVNKIKGYQQQFGSSRNWTRRIVLAAGTCSADGFTDLDKNGTAILKEYIADVVSDKDIVKLYESAGNLSTANMATKINNGALFVNFAGHGDPDSGLFSAGWLFYWAIPGVVWNGFGISDVQSLTNGFKLPVVTTMSCSTARFDDTDCIGEWFVLEPDGGSIAYFGATRVAYSWLDDWAPYGYMGEIDRRIYESYDEGYTRLGQMWGVPVKEYVQSHIWNYTYASQYDVKTLMEFVLLGDPTLRMYNPDYPETSHVPEDFPSIQRAIDTAYDGDIIFVRNGTYHENVVVNKTVMLVGENRNTTRVDGEGTGNVVTVTKDNVSITGFTIQNSGKNYSDLNGIYLSNVDHCNITNNILTNNGRDIKLYGSSNNSITENIGSINLEWGSDYNSIVGNTGSIGLDRSAFNSIVGNNCSGISLGYAGGNSIVGNAVAPAGIRLYRSGGNGIVENIVTANNGTGIHLEMYGWHNSIVGNTVTANNGIGISLAFESIENTSLVGNTVIANNGTGIYFYVTGHHSIVGNTVTANNGTGFDLFVSYDNSLVGNTVIANNGTGISLDQSDGNIFYHNNFVNNTEPVRSSDSSNVWDDGYPSGGNYWSECRNVDEKRGVYQNETGRDGVWDNPYVIDGFNRDNYPFVRPVGMPRPAWTVASFNYSPEDPIAKETQVFFNASESVAINCTISDYSWSFGDGTYGSNMTAFHVYDDHGTYNASLTLDTEYHLQSTATKTIMVRGRPNASFTCFPLTPTVAHPVSFDASFTDPLDGEILDYTWDFGDGNTTSTAEPLITHVYDSLGLYNITLTVLDSEGLNSTYSVPIFVMMPAYISISTICPSTYVGFRIHITGTLNDVYGNKVKDETVVLYYTLSGIGSWAPITSDTTDSNGVYSALWIPPATGYFILKAEWAGNSTHQSASNTTTLSSLPYLDQYILTVESNSTISELTFNTTDWTLTFDAAGSNGTKGYVKITVAKSLVSDIANMKVYVDGIQTTDFSATSMEDSWLLTFNYNHSTHQVLVDLDINIIPEFPSLFPTLFLIATLLILMAKTKKDRAA